MRNIPSDEAVRLYLNGMSVHEVGRVLGFSGVGIWRALKRAGIRFRPGSCKGRPWAAAKRGLEYLGKDGRWWIREPFSRGRKKDRHRSVVVWEQTRGRKVPKGFCVHHHDENVQNDDPSNLRLKKKSTHNRIHHLDKKNSKKGDAMRGKKHSARTIEKMSEARSRYWAKRRAS